MRLSAVAAALAFLAIPAIASAHGGNSDPNIVHACIGNVSKVARIVGVSGLCISAPAVVAETPAHWAIQGPQGAAGTNGTNGAPGINGIDGTNGTNGTNGANGADGIDGTSVMFVGYFSGNENGCPNGGAIYGAGSPLVNAYVCNGSNGIDGTNGTRPDPPCFDATNRYVDCGNGTVTDTVTGLIWLQDAGCLEDADWPAANGVAAALANGQCNLTDGSSAGDWRLPTRDEWSATIARAVALGCTGNRPSLTNQRGTACLGQNGPVLFTGLALLDFRFFWSSTADETFPFEAWFTFLIGGIAESNDKTFVLGVWPVRGGTR